MKIYVAGKITGDKKYREKFEEAKAAIEAEGNITLCPSVLSEGMTAADYMRICFAMIDVADEVWFLPDLIDSEGALLEMQYCRYTGKRIEIYTPPVKIGAVKAIHGDETFTLECPYCKNDFICEETRKGYKRCPRCMRKVQVFYGA